MKLGTLVRVSWIDSCGSGGWRPADVIAGAAGCTVCESIGWLARDDGREIVVAGHRSQSTDEYSGAMAIPRVAIKSIRRVRQ